MMVTEELSESTNRPYTPPSNLISVLGRVRSRNLPERIDLDYLRDVGIPEGTVHRTFFALRFLKLVEESGELTEALKSIGSSTDEEYRAILSGLIRDAYSEVFNVIDPAENTQAEILNVFRRYTPGSQRQRMVIFFLGMCREAGIPTLDVPRQRAMGRPRETAERPAPHTRTGRASLRGTGALRTRGTAQPPDIPPALDGLVRSLPPAGTPLSAERRQQWLDMAKATLAFVYPEEGAPNATTEEEQDNGE
jgi:hypothetical protein